MFQRSRAGRPETLELLELELLELGLLELELLRLSFAIRVGRYKLELELLELSFAVRVLDATSSRIARRELIGFYLRSRRWVVPVWRLSRAVKATRRAFSKPAACPEALVPGWLSESS